MALSDEVLALYGDRGSKAYFGECVSVLEHALQAAHFAHLDGASSALIVAALLHDIGHLLQDVPADVSDWTNDAHHEIVGSRWLARRLGPAVSEPVRLHVPAKRYLLATDAGYAARLSPASIVTLRLQGGPMSAHELVHFEAEPYHEDAIRVRRWDDRGKVAGLETATAGDYRAMIDALADIRRQD